MNDPLGDFFALATLWELQQFQKAGGSVPPRVLAAAERMAALKSEGAGPGRCEVLCEQVRSEGFYEKQWAQQAARRAAERMMEVEIVQVKRRRVERPKLRRRTMAA